MKKRVYIYDSDKHALRPVLAGDHRSELMMTRPPRPKDAPGPAPPPPPAVSNPPMQIILVSDCSRFKAGPPELKYEWGAIDVGIVSQNISIFCAATGLKTRPRASMDKDRIRKILNLTENQHVFLNHPVGYAKRVFIARRAVPLSLGPP